jgi:hypothetical protein
MRRGRCGHGPEDDGDGDGLLLGLGDVGGGDVEDDPGVRYTVMVLPGATTLFAPGVVFQTVPGANVEPGGGARTWKLAPRP